MSFSKEIWCFLRKCLPCSFVCVCVVIVNDRNDDCWVSRLTEIMLLGSWTQQEILWKIPWFKAYAFCSTSAFFPSIFVHALFFMFYVMFAVCAFCAWFPDSLIVFFVWACSSCALFLPFYLWCVCVSYWKMNGKRFPDTFETPPLPSYMYDTYMVYLEISLFLSTYPCVSFSLYLFSPRFLHPSTNLSLTFYLWIYLFYLSINLSYPGPNIYNDIIIMYVNRFSHQKGRHFEVPQHTISCTTEDIIYTV